MHDLEGVPCVPWNTFFEELPSKYYVQ